jgi:predicted alpha/beta hydrolase
MTIYDTRHSSRPAVVTADDGRELAATWYLPGERPRGAVLIAPAMATPARFYADFAWWLASHGLATLTFDYRGTGSRAAMKAETGDLVRWFGDAASALEHLVEDAPDVPVTWLGHSLGGQALPFARHDLVDRALLVAAGSGYWRHNQAAIRYRAPLFFRAIVPVAIRVAGYYPGRRLGLLGDVPPHVMRQWARWCLTPGYFADVPDLEARLAELELPITALSFTDDELLSAASHRALEELYAAAPVEAHRLAPADLGVPRIGHHGFFRSGMEPAWERVVLPHLATDPQR